MKFDEFSKLIDLIKIKYLEVNRDHQSSGLNDFSKIYVEFTWWSHIYKPLIAIDYDRKSNNLILVFGPENCDKYDDSSPCNFHIIYNKSNEISNIIRPLTFDRLISICNMNSINEVEFMLCSDDLPINCSVDINPFRTMLHESRDGYYVLSFYASDGSSTSNRSVSEMTSDNIKYVFTR